MAPPAPASASLTATVRRVLPCLLGLAVATAHAQGSLSERDYFESLPEVLTVSRLAQPISDTPGAVTIIDRKTLQDLNVRDMADVLRLVPGYYVSGYNGANPIAVYHAPLDEQGTRNLVLIDGRPAYSSYYFGGTSRGLMAVNPADVERVEVLRGANSAAYGANAMFGVINIITRHSGDTLGEKASLRLGQGGIRDAGASLGWGDSRASLRLSASRRSDNGLEALFDRRDLRQLKLRADARPNGRDEVQLDVGISDLQSGEGYTGDIDNPTRTLGWRDWHIHGQWRRQVSDTEQIRLSMSLTRERLRDGFVYEPVPAITVDFSGVGRRFDLELQHQLNLHESLRLVWGTGLRVEQAQSMPLFYRSDALSFRESRLFGNLEWRLSPRWLINGGLFLGHHSWTGGFATPRLMANYQIAPDHTLRFGVNRSVRTPTLFELAGDVRYDLGGTTVGRTYAATGQVQPEQLLSHELGYFANWRDRRLTLDVRVFRERMDRLVRRTEYDLPLGLLYTGTKVFDYANQAGPVTSGLEYQLRWSPTTRTSVWVNQSFVDTDWRGNAEISMSPSVSTTLAAFHELPSRLRFGLVLTHRGKMFWRGVGGMPAPVRQLDLHVAYPLRIGTAQARAALTVRGLNGDHQAYSWRFASPVFRRQAFASLQIEF